MRRLNTVGFTIIETMLFLGITGLLIVGVLAGTGASINIQRYRDGITSLQALLQQQYSDVLSVSNDRNNNWKCDSAGNITIEIPGSGTVRGQSDCVILGRFITTTAGSRSLSIKDVVGNVPGTNVVLAGNDLGVLGQYNIKVSPVNSSAYDINWGAYLVKPGGNTAMSFSILILQSPLSGIIRTFINPDVVVTDANISTLVSQQYLTQSVKMCVNSNGSYAGPKMAVLLTAGSTGASGVETLGEKLSGC